MRNIPWSNVKNKTSRLKVQSLKIAVSFNTWSLYCAYACPGTGIETQNHREHIWCKNVDKVTVSAWFHSMDRLIATCKRASKEKGIGNSLRGIFTIISAPWLRAKRKSEIISVVLFSKHSLSFIPCCFVRTSIGAPGNEDVSKAIKLACFHGVETGKLAHRC